MPTKRVTSKDIAAEAKSGRSDANGRHNRKAAPLVRLLVNCDQYLKLKSRTMVVLELGSELSTN